MAPSILSADFGRLAEQVREVEAAGATLLHVDVMDGHFVPNLSIGIPVIEALRRATRLPLDVHLMIEEPGRYVEAFARAGADWISIHAETDRHLHRTVQQIRALGLRAGVALNPATPVSSVELVAEKLDLVVLMSVNPGFSGQSFIESVRDKICVLDQMRHRRGWKLDIEVDGGVDRSNAASLASLGADILVVGSAIFSGGRPGPATREMHRLLSKAVIPTAR
ncbi:MAG: ribulose-phosphate 3-epimerase [Acidobacteriota bacterium]